MLHAKFQTSGRSGSEDEDFFFSYFAMYFYGSNLGPLARGYLGPGDRGLNIFGKRLPGNVKYQITST